MSNLADKFDLLTLSDAAELLHCSKAHVCKAVNGRVRGCAPIPCVSLGRRRLIRRESLRQWLEANERIIANDNVRATNDNARVVNDAKLTTLPVRDAGKRG
jgi:excisionase family DNA binding protein